MKTKWGILAVAGMVVASIPAFSHHSFSAEYDATKPVTIKGKFVSMDWINPHSWVHMTQTTTDGKTVLWKCETPPPNGLFRAGWRKNMLKAGDEITVRGFLAKDGSNTMWSQSVTFADGRRLPWDLLPATSPASKSSHATVSKFGDRGGCAVRSGITSAIPQVHAPQIQMGRPCGSFGNLAGPESRQ